MRNQEFESTPLQRWFRRSLWHDPDRRATSIFDRVIAERATALVVIGDTGCPLEGRAVQDCNYPRAWPFAVIALRAAGHHSPSIPRGTERFESTSLQRRARELQCALISAVAAAGNSQCRYAIEPRLRCLQLSRERQEGSFLTRVCENPGSQAACRKSFSISSV